MGWREILGCKRDKSINMPFGDIGDIVLKNTNAILEGYSIYSHNLKPINDAGFYISTSTYRDNMPKRYKTPYPDCKGWRIADLKLWRRCLECEWAWWTRGVHACILQNDRRVDGAMRTCTLEDTDEQYTDAVAECESTIWEE